MSEHLNGDFILGATKLRIWLKMYC